MKSLVFLRWQAVAALIFSTLLISPVVSQTLTHRYSFNDPMGNGTIADSVGGPSWNGTLVNSAFLDGSMLQLDGAGWATLPGGIMGGASQISIEFWASFSAANPEWTRV